MVRLGVSTATRTGDEEVRRQCVARLGVRWSHAPGTAVQDPGAHKRDSLGLMPRGEGRWMSDTPASTASSALLRERLRHAKESYEENLAQAARDIDMRTEELNSIQDRFDKVAAEKARMERQASK